MDPLCINGPKGALESETGRFEFVSSFIVALVWGQFFLSFFFFFLFLSFFFLHRKREQETQITTKQNEAKNT